MLLSLILLTSSLALLHMYHLESLVSSLIGLPVIYYIWATWVLVLVKFLMFANKYLYVLRALLRKVRRWIDDEGPSGPGIGTPGSATRNGSGTQTRSYSTSARRLSPRQLLERLRDKLRIRQRVSSSVVLTIQKFNDTFRVKPGGLMCGAFARMLPAIGLRKTGYRFYAIWAFVQHCKRHYNACGMKGLVLTLKANSVILQQALGGFRLVDMTPLKTRFARNGEGLSRNWILPQDRLQIRLRNKPVMRFYLTLFNLYRVLEFKGKVSLASIVNPQVTNSDSASVMSQIRAGIPSFVRMLKEFEKQDPKPQRGRRRPALPRIPGVLPLVQRSIEAFPILKSSPSTYGEHVSTSPTVLFASFAVLRKLGLMPYLEYMVNFFADQSRRENLPGGLTAQSRKDMIAKGINPDTATIEHLPGMDSHFDENLPMEDVMRSISKVPWELPSILNALFTSAGKLGIKHEAAGKERVFAMVDAWTQWALHPFHEYCFDLLRRIPMDGTFDQLKPVRDGISRNKGKSCYSLDLTAATDRIPVSVQELIIAELVNPKFAANWRQLLTARSYSITYDGDPIGKDSKGRIQYERVSTKVEYAVGQPMGALSSWSNLAIVHHFLVQLAAWNSGVTPVGTWFKEYAVLGDDVVIWDQRVAREYRRIMAALGVEIGLAKSLLSANGTALEFAKRTFVDGEDVSPIPLKEFISANLDISAAMSYARKYKLTFQEFLRSLGYGFRVRTSLNRPFGQLNARVRLLTLAYFLPSNEEEFMELMGKGNPNPDTLNAFLGAITKHFAQSCIDMIEKLLERANRGMSLMTAEAHANRVNEFADWLGDYFLLREFTGLVRDSVSGRFLQSTTQPVVFSDPVLIDEVKEITGEDPSKHELTFRVRPELYTWLENLWNLFLGASDAVHRFVTESSLRRVRNDLMLFVAHFNHMKATISKSNSPYEVWSLSLDLLRDAASLVEGIRLSRADISMPTKDSVMFKFWKLFTIAVNLALKESREQAMSPSQLTMQQRRRLFSPILSSIDLMVPPWLGKLTEFRFEETVPRSARRMMAKSPPPVGAKASGKPWSEFEIVYRPDPVGRPDFVQTMRVFASSQEHAVRLAQEKLS